MTSSILQFEADNQVAPARVKSGVDFHILPVEVAWKSSVLSHPEFESSQPPCTGSASASHKKTEYTTHSPRHSVGCPADSALILVDIVFPPNVDRGGDQLGIRERLNDLANFQPT